MKRQVKALIGGLTAAAMNAAAPHRLMQPYYRRSYEEIKARAREALPELPMVKGYKAYSRTDDDGVLEEVLRRMGVERPKLLEIGCGDGLENNTHLAILRGASGVWVDGDPAKVRKITQGLGGEAFAGRLKVMEALVDEEGVGALYGDAAAFLGVEELDLFSIDIDSNDYHLVKQLLASERRPRLIIAEYNAKFPPSMEVIARNDSGRWARDDFFGASLKAFDRLLAEDYRLVSCNTSGSNAYFVRRDCAEGFADYTLEEIYQPERYWLSYMTSGHPASFKFLKAEVSGARR